VRWTVDGCGAVEAEMLMESGVVTRREDEVSVPRDSVLFPFTTNTTTTTSLFFIKISPKHQESSD
jgi:hypothetical protein